MTRYALLSVSDKTGLVPFATALANDLGFVLLSTGGTARLLRESGIPVTDVSDYTGFPEMLDGRVKTLHPKVHGGLLYRRDLEAHKAQKEEAGIGDIDLVCVNLYPFEKTVENPASTFEDAIENIDIGGPSMLRSAAKNHSAVTVVTDPADYQKVIETLKSGDDLGAFRLELARKVFAKTAAYDAAIAKYLATSGEVEPDLDALAGYPQDFSVSFPKANKLRYGENPHQQAALYGRFFDVFEQLQGKELSFNNIIDITAAANLIGEFEQPTCAILKHTNPCGVATAEELPKAWDHALATDRQAPFGGIIVVNRVVEREFAQRVREIFCEVVIAPEFSQEALEILGKRKNLRLMIAKEGQGAEALKDIRSTIGGILIQDRDQKKVTPQTCQVVSKRQPTEEEWASMIFGWRVVKHVKSNAIVYTKGERTIGIGAGQMSRVDSSRIAVWKAGEAGLSLDGSVICSDAFFPFADGLEAAAKAGATAAIQPGGSVRDEEVIKAADENDMAMVFTGIRHFRH